MRRPAILDSSIFSVWILAAFFSEAIPALAYEGAESISREEFFIAPLAEANLYSREGAAAGGGAMIGYGASGAAIGIRAIYCISTDMRVLEPAIFLRLYLPDLRGNSGPFVQAETGPVFFGKKAFLVPMDVNAVSAGLLAGWRFLPKDAFFMEAALRAGYPFIAGLRLCMGLRF